MLAPPTPARPSAAPGFDVTAALATPVAPPRAAAPASTPATQPPAAARAATPVSTPCARAARASSSEGWQPARAAATPATVAPAAAPAAAAPSAAPSTVPFAAPFAARAAARAAAANATATPAPVARPPATPAFVTPAVSGGGGGGLPSAVARQDAPPMLAEHGATAAVLAKLLTDADTLHAGGIAGGDPEGRAACPTADGSADWTSGTISTATQTNLRDALPRVLAGMASDQP